MKPFFLWLEKILQLLTKALLQPDVSVNKFSPFQLGGHLPGLSIIGRSLPSTSTSLFPFTFPFLPLFSLSLSFLPEHDVEDEVDGLARLQRLQQRVRGRPLRRGRVLRVPRHAQDLKEEEEDTLSF